MNGVLRWYLATVVLIREAILLGRTDILPKNNGTHNSRTKFTSPESKKCVPTKYSPSKIECTLRILGNWLRSVANSRIQEFLIFHADIQLDSGSRHDTEQQNKLKFLLKATKCKSNSTTDEVRWSTETMVLAITAVARLPRGTKTTVFGKISVRPSKYCLRIFYYLTMTVFFIYNFWGLSD